MDDFTIPDGTRVKLRGHIDGAFYGGMAKTGNEGWITKHRVDSNGLPEAYIEWDREHWADNQQPNRWTYEEHFDPITDAQEMTRMSGQEMNKDKLWQLFQTFQGQATEEVTEETSVDEQQWAHYTQQSDQAREILVNSEAFFMVGVQRKDGGPQAPMGQLVISMAGAAVTPETEALVGHQLSEMAARYHRDAAMTLIQHLTTTQDDDSE